MESVNNMQERVIVAVELDSNKKMQIRVNTNNEALLALALLQAEAECIKFLDMVIADDSKIEHKYLMSVEFDDKNNIIVIINTKNKAMVALSLRKLKQCVDIYLDEQEIKKFNKEASEKLAVVPASVLDRLGG